MVTNYIYDTLNRPVGVTYPTVPAGVAAMPNVCKVNGSATNNANFCLVYGTNAASFNNGRLITMTDASGSESYTYDQFGSATQIAKVIGATTYTIGYAYNLAGDLMSVTYPSNRVVQENVDAIGRLSSVVGTLNSVNTTYASGFAYNPAFQVTGLQYGNGLFASFGFSSDRLQLNCLDYSSTNRNGSCTHDATTKFGLNYGYGPAVANNGQIASITDSMDNGRSVTYTYDALQRLSTAATIGSSAYPAWGLSMAYDRYGNRNAQSVLSGCIAPMSCPTNSVTVSATTNRITGSPYTYDLSGNMTNDGSNTLVYDAENRVVSATNGGGSGSYTYDGNSFRVKKVSGSTTTVYIFSGSKVIAEYDNGAAPASPSREYIYSGGTLLAKIDSIGTKYYHQDHLSNRMVTDSSGNTVAQLGHYPFGESWYNASNDKLLFTTYERDSESDNDFAMARYYLSRLGRFSSPDPLAGTVADPQSLNRYPYSRNDPVNLVDPSGKGFWSWLKRLLKILVGWFLGDRFKLPTSKGTPPFIDNGPLSGTQILLNSIYHPLDPSRYIINNFSLKAQLAKILKNAACAALLGGRKRADQILAHFSGIVNVDTQQSTGELFDRAKNAIDDPKTPAVAETFIPHKGGNFTDGKFTGPNFNTFVGSTFAGYSHSAQLTVEMHEFMHAASTPFESKFLVDMKMPNIPGRATNLTENIYLIHKQCGTDLPPGY